jgi:hypothetical protein
MSTKIRWILLGTGTTVLVLLYAIFHQDISSYIASKSIRPRAVYGNVLISGYASDFDKILIGDPVSNAELYVELPDKRRFLISELPEEVAGQILKRHDHRLDKIRPENSIVYGSSNMHTFLKYRDGKLIFVSLEHDSCPFLISPNKDGPYVELPISRDTLLKVFGKPDHWEKAPKPPSGP